MGTRWWVCLRNPADRQAVRAVFPAPRSEFHFGPEQLAPIGSAFAWVYACGGLGWSPMTGAAAGCGRQVIRAVNVPRAPAGHPG
ncbi:MAG TPA: hypothetical protein VHC86_04520 [Opitutaceae bacterium]|nr:hypothetical protein [Opitutaceae bacterium]